MLKNPVPLFNAASARQIDQKTIQTFGIPGPVLMEQAGRSVATEVLHQSPDLALVVCGKGNNGGDGYIVARWLRHWGISVHVVSTSDPQELSGDALWAWQLWDKLGETTHRAPMGNSQETRAYLGRACEKAGSLCIVDAIFGTGIDRALDPPYTELVAEINLLAKTHRASVIAVDMPSGVNASDGQIMGAAVKADCTVTMGFEKTGLRSWPGRGCAGRIEVVDLGYPQHVLNDQTPAAYLLGTWAFQCNSNQADAHKGTFGHLGLIGGSRAMPGAIALAARAALRAGCGKCSVVSEQGGHVALSAEIMRLAGQGLWSGMNTTEILESVRACDALVCGPGIGRGPEQLDVVAGLIAHIEHPCVLDADALYALKRGHVDHPEQFVLTPHPGEAAALLESTTAEVQANRLEAARALQEKMKSTVVLKGAGTIVCGDESLYISTVANPALAVPGSGDVLAGIIGAQLARGMSPTEAACLGVWLHGETPKYLYPFGNLAGEIADAVPQVTAEYEHRK